MKQDAGYAGIDTFRIIAAFLVVAIHTYPLVSVSETGDFILTRILGRVAVPFFFMATGFFLLPRYMDQKRGDRGSLAKFFVKSCKLYGMAILLFLPVNVYAGYFETTPLLPNLLKDIFFDGTFYHLWYLPATILGAGLVYLLLRSCKTGVVALIAGLLYMIGLGGDSYYGLTSQVPLFAQFYDVLFSFSDYTRNGLFFAPVFLLLGGLIARQTSGFGLRESMGGLAVSLLLLLSEGLLLHHFSLQRHDSMYVMLLPCMFFLFQSLLLWRGKSSRSLRTISMIVYIIHPLAIIVVRGFAKIAKMQPLLIENSIVHYVAVAALSFAGAILLTKLLQRKRERKIV